MIALRLKRTITVITDADFKDVAACCGGLSLRFESTEHHDEYRWNYQVSLLFRWYDLWVGAYIDKPNKTLYVCPLPMVVIRIRRT